MKWPHRYLIVVPESHVSVVCELFNVLQIEVTPTLGYANSDIRHWVIHTAATESHRLALEGLESEGLIPAEVIYFRYDYEHQLLQRTNCDLFLEVIDQRFDISFVFKLLDITLIEENDVI